MKRPVELFGRTGSSTDHDMQIMLTGPESEFCAHAASNFHLMPDRVVLFLI